MEAMQLLRVRSLFGAQDLLCVLAYWETAQHFGEHWMEVKPWTMLGSEREQSADDCSNTYSFEVFSEEAFLLPCQSPGEYRWRPRRIYRPVNLWLRVRADFIVHPGLHVDPVLGYQLDFVTLGLAAEYDTSSLVAKLVEVVLQELLQITLWTRVWYADTLAKSSRQPLPRATKIQR